MLVLTRKIGESLVIGEGIVITLVDIKEEKVRLGISAPKEVGIWRKEVYDEIVASNREARSMNIKDLAEAQKVLEK